MAVVNMVVGATGPDTAAFVAKVDGGGPVRVAVADNPSLSSPMYTSPEAVDAQGVAKVTITGLAPDSRWWWQVEDNGVLDTSTTGRFRTHPPLGVPATFSFALASCAGSTPAVPGVGDVLAPNRLSNHPVFLNIVDRDPLWFSHMGDLHYYDLGSGVVGDGDAADYRRAYDDVLAQPRQHTLYRSVAWQYVWDDHDYGPNNSDGTLPTRGNAQLVYRERVPHYPLPDPDGAGIWQAWQVGRVQFVALDTRSYKDPNSDPDTDAKTMLGQAQKQWLESVLSSSDSSFLVVISPSPWINAPGVADTWEVYTAERAQLVQMFGDHGWLDRMTILWGDRHAMGIDTGSNMVGGMPGGQFAPLDDSTPSAGATWFDTGPEGSQPGQYGVVTFEDLGSAIAVTLSGWQQSNLWREHRFAVPLTPSTPIAAGALVRTLAGSHRALFEARVLRTFQSGDDPDGEPIPILDGDVQMDGTAEVQRSLSLTTIGEWFHRWDEDALLSPYGNEVFVRRGVDLGTTVLWVPLGYFRIDSIEQEDAPDGPIRITGYDRMKTIQDSRLLEPRVYPPDMSVQAVYADLVNEIYPEAVILFDDDSALEPLGRELLVEEDRAAVLLELAQGLGKVINWDDQGFLTVYSLPDSSVPVWEVNAGYHGVQVQASRRITREGVYNAVVAIGEGSDGELPPARGVAIDANPVSPTYWNGRFGKIPRFFASPFLRSNTQAIATAISLLKQSIGLPYSVDFRSLVNPALRPHQPIRVRYRGGDREMHIVERLTIPLDEDTPMTGATREQSLVIVEALT